MIKLVALLTTYLFFSLQEAVGQTLLVDAVVYARGTQEGLPYVSIGIKHSSKGTTSDAAGHFTLQADLQDSLVFSSVGYQTLVLPSNAVPSSVYLKEAVKDLREVTVTAKRKLKTGRIGNLNSKTYLSQGGASQYAMLLQPSGSYDGVLEALYFELQPDLRVHDRWKTAVNIRVYANSHGKPGQDLLPGNVLVSVEKNERTLKVDVSRFNIAVPEEGVFIGLDFLGYFNQEDRFIPYDRHERPMNLRVNFSEALPSFPTFSRFFGTDWQPARHRGRTGNVVPLSAQFGAKVIY